MAVETVGLEIVVNDRGTAVVRRHVEETTRGLQQIETTAKRSGAAVTKATTDAAAGANHLSQGMGKAQVAASALAGGLSGAGAGAQRLTGAISTLLLTGFNPLGLAIAAGSTALGLLVTKHVEAADAAREHSAALKSLFEEARRGQAAVRDIRLGGSAGTLSLEASRVAEADLARRDILSRIRDRFMATRAGQILGNKGGSISLMEIERASEEERRLLGMTAADEKALAENTIRRTVAMQALTDIQGKQAAEAAKALEIEMKSFDVAQERFRFETEARRARLNDARVAIALSEGRDAARALIMNRPFVPTTPTVGGDRAFGFDPEAVGDGPILEPFPQSSAERLAGKFAEENRRIAQASLRPWTEGGARAGDAFVGALGDSLSTAILSGKLDLERLGMTMSEVIIRSFTQALTDALIGNQVRSAFVSLFQGIGGAFAGAPPTAEPGTPGGAPIFSPTLVVKPPDVRIAPEAVLAATPSESARAFTLSSGQPLNQRGVRA